MIRPQNQKLLTAEAAEQAEIAEKTYILIVVVLFAKFAEPS